MIARSSCLLYIIQWLPVTMAKAFWLSDVSILLLFPSTTHIPSENNMPRHVAKQLGHGLSDMFDAREQPLFQRISLPVSLSTSSLSRSASSLCVVHTPFPIIASITPYSWVTLLHNTAFPSLLLRLCFSSRLWSLWQWPCHHHWLWLLDVSTILFSVLPQFLHIMPLRLDTDTDLL